MRTAAAHSLALNGPLSASVPTLRRSVTIRAPETLKHIKVIKLTPVCDSLRYLKMITDYVSVEFMC